MGFKPHWIAEAGCSLSDVEDIFDAKITAARINRSVRSMNIQHENQDLHITTSVGISELSPEDDLSLFVKRADLALYAAKEAGRDRAFWHDGLKEQPVIGASA